MNLKLWRTGGAILLMGSLLISSCEAKRDFPPLTEEGVNLDVESTALVIGDELIISPTFEPNVFPQKTYTWTSDAPNIAGVTMNEDYSATVTALEQGVANLTFSSADGTISDVAKVIVSETGPEDVTSTATLTVSKDNGGGPTAGEGSTKLVDGDTNSKFLTEYVSDFWAQQELAEPRVVGLYSITSGNDAPERDPKNWEISGSNDGETWVVLDSRTDESFSDRNLTREFAFENEEAYKFYRWSITSNNGSNLIQISEWRLLVLPQVPGAN